MTGSIADNLAKWEAQRAQRIELGDHLDEPREVEHFAIFRRRGDARTAASALESQGFVVSESRRLFATSLTAVRSETLTDKSVADFLSVLVQVVELNGGTYDGFGAVVVETANDSNQPGSLGLPLDAIDSRDSSLLVRTDLSDEAAWSRLLSIVQTETEGGYVATLEFVNDPRFESAGWRDVVAALPAGHDVAVLFIADDVTLGSDELPVQVIDLFGGNEPFRCIATELYGIEIQLSIANMDWEDFSENVDADGVFRGFPG